MQIDYDFKPANKFNDTALTYLCQVITQTVGELDLLKDRTSEQFLMEFFHLEEHELTRGFNKLPNEKKTYIKHAYQLFIFLGRGYEMWTVIYISSYQRCTQVLLPVCKKTTADHNTNGSRQISKQPHHVCRKRLHQVVGLFVWNYSKRNDPYVDGDS